MIIREEYLIKRNNKNRIQVALVQLDKHPITGIFTVYRTVFQYKGKKRYIPNIYIKWGRYGNSLENWANIVFNNTLKGYYDIGYYLLSKLTSKKYAKLSEDDLKELLLKYDKKVVEGLPMLMLPKSYEQCSPSILEKDCYCCPNYEGARVLVFNKGGEVQIYSQEKGYLNPEHLTNHRLLSSLFQVIPELVLDCVLYRQGWSINRLLDNLDKAELLVMDYVGKEAFSDRVEKLKEYKELIDCEDINVIIPTISSGWFRIKKLHDNWVKEGYTGALVRFPERPYGEGKKSAYYMIAMQQYKQEDYEITDVTKDGFDYADVTFTVKTPKNEVFKVRSRGKECDLKDYLENKNEYIGKTITCMFFFYDKKGLPESPQFKCLN